MNLAFAAEQLAQVAAAAQAAAMQQYYAANAAAMQQQAAPVHPHPGMLVPTSAPGAHVAPAAAVSGGTVLQQAINAAAAAQQLAGMPSAPAPPAIAAAGPFDGYGREEDPDRDRRRGRRDRRRDRSRSRSRDRERRRGRSRSRSRSRDRRDRDRKRGRDRDRERRRDRSPRRRSSRDRSRSSGSDSEPEPNHTIMIRGLAQHLAENDIRKDITDCGLVARDIRLIRKKETGASRGFAFVEFARIEDAKAWMAAKQGTLLLDDNKYRAVMQYSIPRDGRSGGSAAGAELPRVLHDWICTKCGVQNFRRRDQCFKCGDAKPELGAEGADEVALHPTDTVLLRGLDALTTEDSVLNCLRTIIALPIKSIRIGRDSLTHTSRGVCYVEMNSVADSMTLHNQLLAEPPTIDDKLVGVSYFKTPSNMGSSKDGANAAAAMAAAQWSHSGASAAADGKMSESEVERMAEYSANLYAKTPNEKASYLEYYRNYYRTGGQGVEAPAAATPAVKAKNGAASAETSDAVVVDGVSYKKYPTPDVSTYSYDESSGYYYDPVSTLYYDANSQYYYNSASSQYMYWSAEHSTFLPAPDGEGGKDGDGSGGKKKEGGSAEKKDKVKTAKRIAKDMEKWARTLNQKKESSKVAASAPNATTAPVAESRIRQSGGGGAEDIAFSMLNRRGGAPSSVEAGGGSGGGGLARLAGYGSDSEDDSSAAGGSGKREDPVAALTDWKGLACLLCQRKFQTREKLNKHNNVSELHKENLEDFKRRNAMPSPSPSSSSAGASGGLPGGGVGGFQYRDRAKERRLKYGDGDDDAAAGGGGGGGGKRNSLKESYLAAVAEAESHGLPEKAIDASNVGNRMMQKMGWKEGTGLGKGNKGRTDIIKADVRTGSAGLGAAGSVKANPNECYKDAVKRTLFQRFQQMD